MNISRILHELQRQRAIVDDAINTLERLASLGKRGRPPGRLAHNSTLVMSTGRRSLSASARQRMSIARKKWWAARKAAMA